MNKKNFTHFSVRAFVTDEILKRNLTVNRDNMVLVANDLRARHSPSYIVEQLYEQALKSGKNCIIESIRTPGEVDAMKNKGNFFLFAVDAPAKLRFDRILQRKSETDNVNFDTFLENEKREMNSIDPNKQNISRCIEMADYSFKNDGNIEALEKSVNEIIEEILKK